jgi:hypothetical protein
MLQLADHGLIYDASSRPPHERTASFTGLFRLRSGSIIASFQVGPKKHAATSTVKLLRSDDRGRTWRELPARFSDRIDGIPGSLSSGELAELPDGRWLLVATWFDRSDPERPLFNEVTEGILHSRQLKAWSSDEGHTWSDWETFSTPDLTGCSATGPLLHWSDGTIGYPFESFKEYDDPSPPRHAAWMQLSRDRGQTIADRHLVARDPKHEKYYWDQRLCTAGPDGAYIALFWTHDRATKQDLPVHLARGSIRQANNGEPPVATTIPGQIAAPLLLADGRLLAFVVDRGRPGTMTLWVSADGGRTWPENDRLVVYTHNDQSAQYHRGEEIDFAEYWEEMGKWTFGHPAIRDLGDGEVLLAFYAGAPNCLSGHWARVRV